MASKTADTSGAWASPPLVNALLLAGAIGYAFWLLVQRGRLSWPPTDLLANLYTLAGCLALVGPIVLARRETASAGVGDLLWLTGGLLAWVFDGAAALRGGAQTLGWITPIGAQTQGLTMLAVMLAGLRLREGEREWSWTNVTGWILGLFWVGMGLAQVWLSPSSGTR